MIEMKSVARPRLLRDLALLYIRLGTTAFGGPAVHIALMENEIVRRRQWLTHEEFLDLLGIVNLIPGPNSTQMALQIGYRVAGWLGLLMSGICFIFPAALLTLGLAWIYVRYGTLPQAGAILHGVKAVMVAVVCQAVWNLAWAAIKTRLLAGIGAVAVIAAAFGVNVLLVLFGAGVLAIAARQLASNFSSWASRTSAFMFQKTALLSLTGALKTSAPIGLFPLFAFFLKAGMIVFGSGYVLLAFLRTDLVVRLQWLTDRQLLDAIAVGQITPGPVFTTATFIGYLLGRVPGAAVATIGIFLPSFVLIAVLGPWAPRMRKSQVLGSFLDGVNAGALALMVVVTWYLGRAALVDVTTAALVPLGLIALIRFKINPTWLILIGAIVGSIGGRGLN